MRTNLAIREVEGQEEERDVLVVAGTLARRQLDLPETRLMAAVLESAIAEWQLRRTLHPVVRHGRHVVLEEDVPGWFASTNRSWPYSFENICSALGLDADAIRRRLRVA